MRRAKVAFQNLKALLRPPIRSKAVKPAEASNAEFVPRQQGTPKGRNEPSERSAKSEWQSGGKFEGGSRSGGRDPFWRAGRFNPLVLGLAASGCLGTVGLALSDAGSTPPSTPVALGGGVGASLVPTATALPEPEKKKKLVILGSGWAAMGCLKGLDTWRYDVVLVSPRNYFLFTPLLPGVTSGSVESRSISESVRRIIRGKRKEATYLEAECIGMDPSKKTIRLRDATPVSSTEFEMEYDYLVVAVGACTNTFNTPGVVEHCHFLKEVEDAEKIREHVVDNFEEACLPTTSEAEKKRLLHFVVVGGGPTGVEFAAELHDLVKEDLAKLYPGLADKVAITLIQSGDHILNMFDQRISDFAEKKFNRDGVDVRTGARVVEVTAKDIGFRNKRNGTMQRLEYGLIVWSTGIGTRPVISNLMTQIGQHDRRVLATDEWLRVKGCHDVWALGDCATIEHRPMRDDISLLFKMADTDGDGMLSAKEFSDVVAKVKERYPQISLYLQRNVLRSLLQDVCPDENGRQSKTLHRVRISIGEFEAALGKVDAQMKAFPATAQVAAQQGEYLAQCFNKLQDPEAQPEGPLRVRGTGRHRFHPFQYRHLGQFAPLGSGQAGVELPGDWVNVGRSTQWLWYSVYASKQVSWRTRCLVVFDWTKRAIFGRDSSRM